MLRYRWLLIAGVTVFAALAIWRWGIRLGLDLKGGIHLVLRVQTDDAIESELEAVVNRLRLDFDEQKIAYGTVAPLFNPAEGVYRVTVDGLAEASLSQARLRAEESAPSMTIQPVGAALHLDLTPTAVATIRNNAVDQAVTTIRGRVNATGVAEEVVQREGFGSDGDRIIVQLPGVENAEGVKRLIGRVAFLELKLVERGPFESRDAALAAFPGGLPPTLELVEGLSDRGLRQFYAIERSSLVTGNDLSRAVPTRSNLNQWTVSFTLKPEGAERFAQATRKNIGRQLAVILDGQVKSAPVIEEQIRSEGQIRGNFTADEARELALVLREGALPAKIQYLEERSVTASLGRDSIDRGKFTSIVGMVLVVLLMAIYYRRSGLNAVAALVLNAILLLGALAFLQATLTLPGIAGFILTLGMAVDANVLVFEAIRENLRSGQGVRRAIEEGFSRAFTTIVDSNLTTLLAAGALWMLGSGPVRGFGVTLFIGLTVNIFTAYYVSKTIFESTVLNRELAPGETLSI